MTKRRGLERTHVPFWLHAHGWESRRQTRVIRVELKTTSDRKDLRRNALWTAVAATAAFSPVVQIRIWARQRGAENGLRYRFLLAKKVRCLLTSIPRSAAQQKHRNCHSPTRPTELPQTTLRQALVPLHTNPACGPTARQIWKAISGASSGRMLEKGSGSKIRRSRDTPKV